MTYLEIAKQVLQESGKPLPYLELWENAEKFGWTQQKNIKGKTPWNTLSALLILDIRDNPNSPFIRVAEKPIRFGLKEWQEPNNLTTDTPQKTVKEDIEGDAEEYETTTQLLDPQREDLGEMQEKWSVFDHLRKLEKGRMKIGNDEDQAFQRKSVWSAAQKSRFIESILMGFPIPPFYLNLRTDGSYLVIDGLQRTIALKEFWHNEFALEGLRNLTHCNGKRFSELAMYLQAKIEDKGLNIYILMPTTPLRLVYEMFDRLNTGGTLLSRQEVRNGIFVGKSTQFLKKLAEEPYFKQATDNSIPSIRMKDRECILRYLAFRINGYESYKGDMSPFLEQTMTQLNDSTDEKLQTYEADFKRTMDWATRLFGNQCFRLPVYDAEGKQKSRGPFNVSVMESVCLAISDCSDNFLQQNKDQVNQNYDLLSKNDEYRNAVKSATGGRIKVLQRFNLAKEILTKL